MQNQNILLNVIGMNCMGCVKTITTALQKIPGVETVNCDLSQKTVSVKYNSDSTSDSEIKQTIIDEGFKIKE